MLLKAFTEHFCGLAELKITVLRYLGFQPRDFNLVGFAEALFAYFRGLLFLDNLPAQLDDLRIHFLYGSGNGKLSICLGGFRFLLENRDFRVLLGEFLLLLCFSLSQNRLLLGNERFSLLPLLGDPPAQFDYHGFFFLYGGIDSVLAVFICSLSLLF